MNLKKKTKLGSRFKFYKGSSFRAGSFLFSKKIILVLALLILSAGFLSFAGNAQAMAGDLDLSFSPGVLNGANDLIQSTNIQSDGKILIGGFFTTYNNYSMYCSSQF